VTRPVLSLRPKAQPASAQPANDQIANGTGEAHALISGAIARTRCLHARYNGGDVILQPCFLYREHDALFLLAVTALRDGKPPREAKMGTFRVSGLAALRPTDETFVRGDLHKEWADKPGRDLIAGL
jgi:hypothetical protein